MDTWREKHPDWHYTLYDNDYLTNRKFRTQHLIIEYFRRKQYAGVSDLMRYEILWEKGGFIPEADSICLNATDPVFTKATLYTVFENEKIVPGYVSPFLASTPRHDFVGLTIKRLRRLRPDQLRAPWRTTGNKFLAKLIARRSPEITIFPSHYFIPTHFQQPQERYSGPDTVYAEQKWGSTTNSYKSVLALRTKEEEEVLWKSTLEKLEANQ